MPNGSTDQMKFEVDALFDQRLDYLEQLLGSLVVLPAVIPAAIEKDLVERRV
ncbi:MAG: hypothetical protein U5O39_13025 [Gammaproteobacteria bacterium]|nr:hypothetical protein [Gammaproteobacteria bacterium]